MHGCLKTFKRLLREIEFQKSDQLILLGDYVSKGSDPLGTLEFIYDLKNSFNVIPLIGNHDVNILDYLIDPSSVSYSDIISQGNQDFLSLSQSKKIQIISFLQEMPFYYENEEFIFVHAGFDFKLQQPFLDKYSMLNTREMSYDPAKANNKTIIHGHVPTKIEIIQERISSRSNLIPLDNGCVYSELDGMGNLLCLEMKDMKLFIEPNID
ncbi:MAG: serine/threonine protein phosphatase 1 [Cyclobacteriaceae bacterium]